MTKRILLFALTISLLSISCKKEKLKDEYSILIGEWKQTKLIDQYFFNCKVDSFESSNPWKVTFKKNGKIFLKQYEVEDKYLIRFKDNSNNNIRENKRVFFCHGNEDSIENFYTFETTITQRFSKEKSTPTIYVTEDKLVIVSSSTKIISPPCEECMDPRDFLHIFEKVN